MADRYEGKYIDREFVNGQWAGIKAGPMPVAYTGSIQDPDKIRNTSLIIPSSSEGAPSVSSDRSFAVTTIRYGESAYIQQAIDLMTLNTFIRYHNGISWGAWVAGNDNTNIDNKIRTIQNEITNLGNRVSSASTTANNAISRSTSNKNSIDSINSKNNQQDTNINRALNQSAAAQVEISMFKSDMKFGAASKWFPIGNPSANCINNYNAGTLTVTKKANSKFFYRQRDDGQGAIVQEGIPTSQHVSLYDFAYNCRCIATGDTSFKWSDAQHIIPLVAQAEGVATSKVKKIRLCGWPIVSAIDAEGRGFYITAGSEHTGLTMYCTNTDGQFQLGRLQGVGQNFGAFNLATVTRNGSVMQITGTFSVLFDN
jgi:hypothetical protein